MKNIALYSTIGVVGLGVVALVFFVEFRDSTKNESAWFSEVDQSKLDTSPPKFNPYFYNQQDRTYTDLNPGREIPEVDLKAFGVIKLEEEVSEADLYPSYDDIDSTDIPLSRDVTTQGTGAPVQDYSAQLPDSSVLDLGPGDSIDGWICCYDSSIASEEDRNYMALEHAGCDSGGTHVAWAPTCTEFDEYR